MLSLLDVSHGKVLTGKSSTVSARVSLAEKFVCILLSSLTKDFLKIAKTNQ